MGTESDSPDGFGPLPISDEDELECLNEAEIEVCWWSCTGHWEEPSLARGMRLALVQRPEPHPLIFRDFLEVVGILEDVKVILNIELLIAHVKQVVEGWAGIIIL